MKTAQYNAKTCRAIRRSPLSRHQLAAVLSDLYQRRPIFTTFGHHARLAWCVESVGVGRGCRRLSRYWPSNLLLKAEYPPIALPSSAILYQTNRFGSNKRARCLSVMVSYMYQRADRALRWLHWKSRAIPLLFQNHLLIALFRAKGYEIDTKHWYMVPPHE